MAAGTPGVPDPAGYPAKPGAGTPAGRAEPGARPEPGAETGGVAEAEARATRRCGYPGRPPAAMPAPRAARRIRLRLTRRGRRRSLIESTAVISFPHTPATRRVRTSARQTR